MPSVEILDIFEKSERPERPTHSPGPWHDKITPEGDLIVFIPAHGQNCKFLEFGDMEDTEGEDHANARLIAAAPDLLEACRAAMLVVGGIAGANAIARLCERAIAKAATA